MVKRFIYVIWKIVLILLALISSVTFIFTVYLIILDRSLFEDLETVDDYIMEKLKL
jgi:hypothetical protein